MTWAVPASPLLPTAAEQMTLRRAPPELSPLAALLLVACLWGASAVTWRQLVKTPIFKASGVTRAVAMPAVGKEPLVVLALASEALQPVHQPARRTMQHMRDDLTTLFGHVVQELLRDEFESVILKLSLGQQVAVHLQDSLAQPR